MLAQLWSEKTVLLVITLVGMAFCATGIGQVAARGEWLHPLSILAYIVGALVLLVAGAALFDIRLPWIDSTRAAIIAVTALALVKVALTFVHRSLLRGAS
jgi:hypothetical protein